MPRVDFLHVQVAQAHRECTHGIVAATEQVEPAEHRIDFLAGERGADFLHDVVCPAVTAAVHHEQALGRIEYQTLFVFKTVVAVLAVLLHGEVCCAGDSLAGLCAGDGTLVWNQVHVRRNLRVAFRKPYAVGEALQEPPADADVFVVGDGPENLVRVVAVFAGALAQVEGCSFVNAEEFRHPVCMVVVRVAEYCDIHLREVHPHGGGVLREMRGGSRIEQVAAPVEFYVDGKAPFAMEGRAFTARTICRGVRTARDIVY